MTTKDEQENKDNKRWARKQWQQKMSKKTRTKDEQESKDNQEWWARKQGQLVMMIKKVKTTSKEAKQRQLAMESNGKQLKRRQLAIVHLVRQQ